MKRYIFTVLLFLLLGLILPAYAESSELVEFSPEITSTVPLTAEEWMTTSTLRAELTYFLFCDMSMAVNFDDNTPDLTKTSFVGRSDNNLYIYVRTQGGKGAFIGYVPSAYYAMYKIVDDQPDINIKASMLQTCPDGFEINEPDEIASFEEELQKMWGDN